MFDHSVNAVKTSSPPRKDRRVETRSANLKARFAGPFHVIRNGEVHMGGQDGPRRFGNGFALVQLHFRRVWL